MSVGNLGISFQHISQHIILSHFVDQVSLVEKYIFCHNQPTISISDEWQLCMDKACPNCQNVVFVTNGTLATWQYWRKLVLLYLTLRWHRCIGACMLGYAHFWCYKQYCFLSVIVIFEALVLSNWWLQTTPTQVLYST